MGNCKSCGMIYGKTCLRMGVKDPDPSEECDQFRLTPYRYRGK